MDRAGVLTRLMSITPRARWSNGAVVIPVSDKIVDLIGVAPRDCGDVGAGIVMVWGHPMKRILDCLGVLGCKQYPHDVTLLVERLVDFLTDPLPIAVTVSGKPTLFYRAQSFATPKLDGSHFNRRGVAKLMAAVSIPERLT